MWDARDDDIIIILLLLFQQCCCVNVYVVEGKLNDVLVYIHRGIERHSRMALNPT